MNFFLLFMLLLTACSWRQKDFEKDLDDPVVESTEVQVDEKLREKFEVKPVETPPIPTVTLPKTPEATAPASKTKVPPVKVSKAPGIKPTPAIVPAPPKLVPPPIKSLPKDYPPVLLELNAKAKKTWDLYKPNHHTGEKTYLDIHYLGMTVGKILVQNNGKKMIGDKEVWHFHARFKSAPFYSNIYELNDTVDTYVTTEKFLSIKYSLVQRESKVEVDDLQLHDRETLKSFMFYHQKKSNGDVKDKKDEKPIPFYSIDPFSMLFFYQGLPLKNGDIYEIPIINKGKILVLKSLVEGREKIETKKGNRKAIRVHATTQYSGDTLKSGDLYFWFSDDEKKNLLKAQAKIKIGSVTADIVD